MRVEKYNAVNKKMTEEAKYFFFQKLIFLKYGCDAALKRTHSYGSLFSVVQIISGFKK